MLPFFIFGDFANSWMKDLVGVTYSLPTPPALFFTGVLNGVPVWFFRDGTASTEDETCVAVVK